MHTPLTLLLELGIILVVLSGLGALARRAGLPPIPLYLLAGLALGDGGIAPVPAAGEFVHTGAAIGVVLLLLTLGLEFTTAEFVHSLRRHVPSAVLDLALNAAPGAVAGWLLGLNAAGILALAGATWILFPCPVDGGDRDRACNRRPAACSFRMCQRVWAVSAWRGLRRPA